MTAHDLFIWAVIAALSLLAAWLVRANARAGR